MACLLLTPVWGMTVGISFHGVGVAVIVLALLIVNAAYRQFRPGPANPASVMIESTAAFIAFSVWAPLTYLSARSSHPLIDPMLSRLDHLLGFDWNTWRRFVENIPELNLILHIAYSSIQPQAVVAMVWLPLVKGGRRSFTLVRQGMVAGALTCLLFWLFPALGTQDDDWTTDMLALRGTSPLTFDLLHLKGIVSFPSFHTVLGILFIYAFRGTYLSAIAIAINLLMIVSALSVGSHYLTDILAGFLVATVSILIVEWIGNIRWPADASFHPVPGKPRGLASTRVPGT